MALFPTTTIMNNLLANGYNVTNPEVATATKQNNFVDAVEELANYNKNTVDLIANNKFFFTAKPTSDQTLAFGFNYINFQNDSTGGNKDPNNNYNATTSTYTSPRNQRGTAMATVFLRPGGSTQGGIFIYKNNVLLDAGIEIPTATAAMGLSVVVLNVELNTNDTLRAVVYQESNRTTEAAKCKFAWQYAGDL
jgi:hypothetical protein